jgi:hypothetical protein
LLTAASIKGRRSIVRPLKIVRSAIDADDHRTALRAPPTARLIWGGAFMSDFHARRFAPNFRTK